MTEVETQLNTEIAKKHCFLASAILLFISHLEALCLNVTLNTLTIAYSKI